MKGRKGINRKMANCEDGLRVFVVDNNTLEI
jgi:hypothetical protein